MSQLDPSAINAHDVGSLPAKYPISDAGAAELDKRFLSHPIDDEQSQRIASITADFRTLAHNLVVSVPQGRELAMALTDLERAKFIAVAGIAREKA